MHPYKVPAKCQAQSRCSRNRSPSLEQIFKPQVLVVSWGCILSFLCGVSSSWPCFAVSQAASHSGSFQTAPWGLLSSGSQSQRAARKSAPCCRAPAQKDEPGAGDYSDLSPVQPTSPTPDCMLPHRPHLDVHSWCKGWLDSLRQREVSLLNSPMNDIIAVHCCDQVDGQAHLLSDAPSLRQERRTTTASQTQLQEHTQNKKL